MDSEDSMSLPGPILRFAAVALLLGFAAVSHAQVETKSFQIWTSRDAQQGALPVVAARKGFFEKEGLNVEVKFVSSGSEIPAGMAGGTIPMAIASWTNPMVMVANGLPVRILAATTDISAAQQLVVRKDGPIKTPKDLEGKKLALTRIGLVMSILEKMCKEYGCDVSKITLINMQPEEIVLAFERGDVDAVQTWEPWATYATQHGGKILLSATESFVPGKEGKKRVDGVYAAVFARDDFVSKNPKTVQAALRALKNAAEWLEANPDAGADIVAKDINIPKPVVLATFSKIHNEITMTSDWAKEFDQKAQYLANIKELKKVTTAAAAFDPQPLKQVCSSCVKGM
jgi:ABC-type nitrate/sulfonate/bicarbonate transport system substrate-binding protein